MADYPIDARLRPIHEYHVAFVYLIATILFLLIPEYLMLADDIGYLFAAVCFWRLVVRFRQGRRIQKYQKLLWRYVPIRMKRRKLPVSTRRLYLGHGFEWTSEHTQRLADVTTQSYFGVRPEWHRRIHSFIDSHEMRLWVQPLVALRQWPSSWNPLRLSNPPNDSGNVALHGVGSSEGDRAVYLADAQRTGHVAIFGSTGVGKTIAFITQIRQDIAAGHITIVLDPKGDISLLNACYQEAKRAGRLDGFHCFHLGFPEFSSGYSPVGTFSRVTEVASRISSLLPGEGQSLAFREFVWRLVNVIARAMTELGGRVDVAAIGKYGQDIDPLAVRYLEYRLETIHHRDGAWRGDIERMIRQKRYRRRAAALSRYFQEHRIEDPLADSLIYIVQYDRQHFEKLTGSLLPLIDKLTTGKTADLLAPDYGVDTGLQPVFTWPEVIRSGGIVYVGFDSLTDPDVSSAVGNSMFADLTSTLGEIYKHRESRDATKKICVYADEFSELVGDQFIQLLNKGRDAGLRVTTGAQTREDLPVGFGDRDKAEQALGNYNSVIMFRARNTGTAEMLIDQLPTTTIHSKTVLSSERSTDTFTSSSEQRLNRERIKMLEPAHLAQLPPGEAFALIDGGKLYKIKVPLLTELETPEYDSIGQLMQHIREEQAGATYRPREVPVTIGTGEIDQRTLLPAVSTGGR
ncbi:MAG: conjugal transfer protein TraG [Gammaproteobacteria bacterium]|nr:MAG: conjugal transfer protein TraG [Gammaproteobacteria bacterium]